MSSFVAPRHTELVLSTDSSDAPRISEFTAFNQIHVLPNGSTLDTTRLYVPRLSTTTVGSTMKSCQTFSYVVDTLRRFGSDRKLGGAIAIWVNVALGAWILEKVRG